jgi:hypothetical protein
MGALDRSSQGPFSTLSRTGGTTGKLSPLCAVVFPLPNNLQGALVGVPASASTAATSSLSPVPEVQFTAMFEEIRKMITDLRINVDTRLSVIENSISKIDQKLQELAPSVGR